MQRSVGSLPSSQVKNIYQNIIENFKKSKMYQEISYDSFMSQQSSDILPNRQRTVTKFLPSDQQISQENISLYSDILPHQLLYEPQPEEQKKQEREKTLHDMFSKNDRYYVFDSIVSKSQLHEKQIELSRKKRLLDLEVENRRLIKHSKIEQLRRLRGEVRGKKKAQKQAAQINKIADTKIRKLKQQIKVSEWFQSFQQTCQKKEQTSIVVISYQEEKLESLHKLLQKYNGMIEQLYGEIEQKIGEQRRKRTEIKNRRVELKQKMIQNCIQKQKGQIQQLEISIKKMEDQLQRMF